MTQPKTTRAGAIRGGSAPYGAFDLMPIAGEWREGRSGKAAPNVDPYTGGTLLEIPLANAEDVDEAYRAAAEAQRAWASLPPQERRDVMDRAAEILLLRSEEVTDWLAREAGGARVRAEAEIRAVHAGLKEAATFPMRTEGRILPALIPGKESRVYRAPVGVVGVVSPWNLPMQLANRSIAPALAVGNAVVAKPASDTPVTGALLLAKIYEEAGLPPGVLSVVVGSGSEIGDPFVEHPIPRVISFTGSTDVGRRVGELCGRTVKKAALELGGNSPFIVLEDADLGRAVDAAIFGKFLNQGQICMSINRILVDAAAHDEFLERFAERAASLKAGDPKEPDTVVGPVINRHQLEGIEDKVRDALASGARRVVGGEVDGLVMRPQVLSGVTNGMRIAQEEVFGPVASVVRVDGEEAAIRVANDTAYGLSSAVFTRDAERGVRVARRLEAGMTHVNDQPANGEPNAPFGGEKQSGLGRFGGEWALQEFTTDHWISVQLEPRAYPF